MDWLDLDDFGEPFLVERRRRVERVECVPRAVLIDKGAKRLDPLRPKSKTALQDILVGGRDRPYRLRQGAKAIADAQEIVLAVRANQLED